MTVKLISNAEQLAPRRRWQRGIAERSAAAGGRDSPRTPDFAELGAISGWSCRATIIVRHFPHGGYVEKLQRPRWLEFTTGQVFARFDGDTDFMHHSRCYYLEIEEQME